MLFICCIGLTLAQLYTTFYAIRHREWLDDRDQAFGTLTRLMPLFTIPLDTYYVVKAGSGAASALTGLFGLALLVMFVGWVVIPAWEALRGGQGEARKE